MIRHTEYPCTSDLFCSDPSRRVQVHKRNDAQGNASGGFVLLEGGRQESAFFDMETLKRFVEDMAGLANGTVLWGFSEMQRAQS